MHRKYRSSKSYFILRYILNKKGGKGRKFCFEQGLRYGDLGPYRVMKMEVNNFLMITPLSNDFGSSEIF